VSQEGFTAGLDGSGQVDRIGCLESISGADVGCPVVDGCGQGHALHVGHEEEVVEDSQSLVVTMVDGMNTAFQACQIAHCDLVPCRAQSSQALQGQLMKLIVGVEVVDDDDTIEVDQHDASPGWL
jgi:hypothetical protein